jgi:hypothetical protein
VRTDIPASWAGATLALAILAAITKAAGAFAPGTYRDGVWAASQMRGADVVALLTLVPLLAVAAVLARRGTPRGLVLWLAALHVLVYDVAFYLFGAAFNAWFLAYAALVAGALMLLTAALVRLDIDAVGAAFGPATPRRWPAALLTLLGVGLGGLWIGQSVAFLTTGVVPSSVAASGHPTALVFAIDLTLLVPFFLWGAVGLAAGRPWGAVLAATVATSGAVYTLLLAGMAVRADPTVVEGARALIPLWLALSAISATVAVALLRHLPERLPASAAARRPVPPPSPRARRSP